MPGFMTVLRMWIFCLMEAGDVISCLLCFFVFSIVMSLCVFHLSEGTRCIPKYVYDSFWERVGKGLFLNRMFCACMNALKTTGFNLDLLGLPVMAHLARFRSRYAHSEIFCSLVICGCMLAILSVMIAKSSAYAVVLHDVVDVLK